MGKAGPTWFGSESLGSVGSLNAHGGSESLGSEFSSFGGRWSFTGAVLQHRSTRSWGD